MSADPWFVSIEHRCMHGRKRVYKTERPLCASCTLAHFDTVWNATVTDEVLGAIHVHGRTVPFICEVRLGLRSDQLELIHRFTASDAQQEATCDAVDTALRTGLGCEHLL